MKTTRVEEVDCELELEEAIHLHKIGWVIQRIGWILILAIIVAGAIGVFGGGIISEKKLSKSGIDVSFERYYRYETEMRILVESNAAINNISLPQAYLKSFKIVRFVPEPLSNQSTSTDIVYKFAEPAVKIVSLYIIPKTYGTVEDTIKVNGNTPFNLKHFIYP